MIYPVRNIDLLRHLLDQVDLGDDSRTIKVTYFYADGKYNLVIFYDDRVIMSSGLTIEERTNIPEFNRIQDTIAGGMLVNMVSDSVKFMIIQSKDTLQIRVEENLN